MHGETQEPTELTLAKAQQRNKTAFWICGRRRAIRSSIRYRIATAGMAPLAPQSLDFAWCPWCPCKGVGECWTFLPPTAFPLGLESDIRTSLSTEPMAEHLSGATVEQLSGAMILPTPSPTRFQFRWSSQSATEPYGLKWPQWTGAQTQTEESSNSANNCEERRTNQGGASQGFLLTFVGAVSR